MSLSPTPNHLNSSKFFSSLFGVSFKTTNSVRLRNHQKQPIGEEKGQNAPPKAFKTVGVGELWQQAHDTQRDSCTLHTARTCVWYLFTLLLLLGQGTIQRPWSRRRHVPGCVRRRLRRRPGNTAESSHRGRCRREALRGRLVEVAGTTAAD